jgi:hypothetical protein
MKVSHWIGFVGLPLWVFLGCSHLDEKVAGNGSEVENGIAGVVFQPNAAKVSGAVVTLIPTDYNPFTDTNLILLTDTTDASGRFAFNTAPSDSYNLEVASNTSDLMALVSSLHSDTLILSEAGSITLEKSKLQSAEVYIPGSKLKSSVDSEKFVWKSLPSGVFDLYYRKSQATLANKLPVVGNHNTSLPAQIFWADSDTYLESAEPTTNWGGKLFLRLKSQNQGIILLHFDLRSASASKLDTATLWLTISEFLPDFVNYSYQASVYGFTSPWVEGQGMYPKDTVSGSTFAESKPGTAWPIGFPTSALDFSSRLDVSFQGIRGVQQKHPVPISGKILQGLQNGTYTAIVLIENTQQYNNVDFSSSEGSHPPELHVFTK